MMNSKCDQFHGRRSSVASTGTTIQRSHGRRSFSSDVSWMRGDEVSRHTVDYIPRPSQDQMNAIPRPPTFGSRAPEVKQKKKMVYNSQITSVSSAIYDENWASKQADSFIDWANSVFLTSMSATDSHARSAPLPLNGVEDPLKNTVNAEKNNNNGFNEFIQKKNDSINREKVSTLYHSQSTVMGCIEQSIHSNNISLRDDRNILSDLGLQQTLLDIIFNYETPWIKLGLETVFGEIISLPISQKNLNNFQSPCESGCIKWRNILKLFIQEKLFINEGLVMFSKFQNKNLNEIKRQYLLKKFLFFVLFLDNAKKNNILNLPTLFVRDNILKSSKDILLEFYKELMKGEGDFIRHLNSVGYSVFYFQTPLDEFDFTVTNIETDFRDGVRLVRLMEVLTRRNTGHMERVDEKQKESEGYRRSQSKCSGTLLTSTSSSTLSSASRLPSANLRVPATSRLQKLHNVSLALKLLYGMGPLPLPRHTGISASPVHVLGCGESSAAAQGLHRSGGHEQDRIQEAREIVNGHRDRTLQLMWKIIFVFKLRYIVSPHRVMEECSTILHSKDSERFSQVYGISDLQDLAVSVSMKGADLTLIDSAQSLQEKKSIILSSISIPSKLVGESDSSFRVLSDASQLINSLTEWCHTITNPYGVQVHNLTTNLADGRALCLIINHYHPLILPLNNICHTTVSLLHPPNSTERGSGHDIIALRQGKQLATSYPIQILSKDDVRRGLEGERRNFDLLRSSCLIIGGLPMMMPVHDTSDVPEERTMLLFLGYLFCRLIESSNQFIAAVKIQKIIRRRNEKRKKEEKAAQVSKAAHIIRRRVGTYMQVCKYREIIAEWRAYKSMTGPLYDDGEYSSEEYSLDDLLRLEEEQEEYLRISFEGEERRIRKNEVVEEGMVEREGNVKEEEPEESSKVRMNCNTDIDNSRDDAKFKNDTHCSKENMTINDEISYEVINLTNVNNIVHDIIIPVEVEEMIKFNCTGDEITIITTNTNRMMSTLNPSETNNEIGGVQKMDKNIEIKEENIEKKEVDEVIQVEEKEKIEKVEKEKVEEVKVKKEEGKVKKEERKQEKEIVGISDTNLNSYYKDDMIKEINENKNILKGFLRLQAVFFGRGVREKSDYQVRKALLRIKQAEKSARNNSSLKLEVQTKLALAVLQTKKSISVLLKAAVTLQMSTKYSYNCCHTFVSAQACRILFALIRSCNRTVAHQELLRCSLTILLNASKYSELVAVVADDAGAADTLVDLMQMFRDRKNIFVMTSLLLSRLIVADKRTKELCSKFDFKKRLEGILHILDRRTRLDEKVKKTEKSYSNSTTIKSLKFVESNSTTITVEYPGGDDNDDYDYDKENSSSTVSSSSQNIQKEVKKQKEKRKLDHNFQESEIQDPLQSMQYIMQLLIN